MFDLIQSEFTAGIPDLATLIRIILRLLVTMLCGFAIGFERQRTGHSAGIRTHMLVSLGATIFVLVPSLAGAPPSDVSRIIQGVAAGIGFLGAGSIMKLSESHQIRGLTTAAGLWVTTAIGTAVGVGRLGVAVLCVVLTLIILTVLHTYFPGPSDTAPLPNHQS
jgi:putative Mg2+ transporter-C (MgtC) family protein